MSDFSKGIIYALRSPHTPKEYVGSTIQPAPVRLIKHRSMYNSKKANKCISVEIFQAGDVYIEVIEEYPCENRKQLHKREGQIARTRPNCINKKIAGRTRKEYYEENKEQIRKERKEHRENNREEINRKKSENYHKNKEKIRKQQKAYREKNREEINRKKQEAYRKRQNQLVE